MMKRLGNIFLTIFIVVLSLFFAVGCDESKPQEKKGNIKIVVSSNQKGVDLSNLTFISYIIIEGTGPDNTSFSTRIDSPLYATSVSELTQGLWYLEANAYNKEDRVIGTGKTSLYLSETTPEAKILIDLSIGFLKVSLNGSSDKTITYTAHILKETGDQFEEITSKDLTGDGELISASFFLEMGDYYVQITSTNENIILPEIEHVTIGDHSKPIRHDIQDGPEFSKNPKVEITSYSTQTIVGNKIQVKAKSYNITSPVYSWFLNTNKLDSNSDFIEFSLDKEGDYILKCCVSGDESITVEEELALSVLPVSEEMISVSFWDGEEIIENRLVLPGSDQSFPFVSQKDEFVVSGWTLAETGDFFKPSTIFSLPPSEGGYRFEIVWEDLNRYYSISEDGELTKKNNGLSLPDIGELRIPESLNGIVVTSIGDSAFESYSSLTSIIIPDTVTSISKNAFRNCTNLTSINIPNGITIIEDGVFLGCTSLRTIVIPEGVTSIGKNAFANCSSLISISLPSTLESIGDYAFNKCESLYNISLPEGLTDIGNNAFAYCSNLLQIDIPNSVKLIGYSAFENCSSLKSIFIPDSFNSDIGDYTFSRCHKLTDVHIGNSVTLIGINAFNGCNIANVTIPDSVTDIYSQAFANCSNLSSVRIGSGIKRISENAFENTFNPTIYVNKIKNSVEYSPWGAVSATVKWKGEF